MPQRFEGHFTGSDQTELFFQTWAPDKVRGVMIITHGLAEHSECYNHVAKMLSDDGWQIFAWDLRGHGRSEGKRGYVRDISYFVDDLSVLHREVRRQFPSENLIFLGHSLGGLITLRFLETHPVEHSAVVLSSPCVGLSVAVPKFKQALAHVALKWMPTLTMHNELKYEDLSRDEEKLKGYRTDTLRQDKISPGLFLSMVDAFGPVLEDAGKIQTPVLMQLAGEDRIVSTAASRVLFERLPNKKSQAIVYPDSYHEVYNDLDREQVFADLKKFTHTYLKESQP
ncbi:MAG TPA: alpha/beta hydrolase [Bdellovibrionales bacterium]|nr:alpha/beta hydrolase [Bdellovibrionales bacterium]